MVDLEKHYQDWPKAVRGIRVDRLAMTQEGFAEMMGVSVSTVRAWEQGSTVVPVYVMRALSVIAEDPARALGALAFRKDGTMDGTAPVHWYDEDPVPATILSEQRRSLVSAIRDEGGATAAVLDTMDRVAAMKQEVNGLGGIYATLRGPDILNLYMASLLEQLVAGSCISDGGP